VRLVRGRGIGGSSATNGLMFLRGHWASYTSWENVGAESWGFDDLLPYFKRSETVDRGVEAGGCHRMQRISLSYPHRAVIAAHCRIASDGWPARSVWPAPTTSGAWRSPRPGPAADDDDALRNFAKAAYQSYNHPVGTCAMGDTDMSVVDSELRVHGISGLRVADASVMPSIPSANTAATVYAIAERAAELIGG
jgi:choline dehydrogenase-like flavoprotein